MMVNKVVSLRHAIESNVKPGMTVHISLQAGAATCELVRQFWGQKPDFTLIMNMIGGHHALSLVHGGLIKKLIFATCADIYPRPYPNPVIQRAFKSKACKLENWSMLSLTQALMAGALNLPFMPTRSVIGSSLEQDNQHAIRVVEDVFGGGEKVGLIKSLCPDVSIIHGWAADAMGNVILPGPPRDTWGAKASKNGIIVCTEKIVGEDFIRQHSLLVRVPGSLVNAVCLAPFGSHPQNMSAQSLPEFEGYGLDHAFLKALRKATEDSEAYSQWVKEWILDCRSHEDYLDKLGEKRLQALKRNDSPPVLKAEKKESRVEPTSEKEATPAEYAIINGARIIKDIIVKHRYKSMFAGIGISGLAGWCAYYFLKEKGHHVDLIAAGIGYEPCPGDPLLISSANMATAKMISDSLDLHGVGAGGINSSCLGVLGAGQIDKYGNINSTIIQSRKGDEIYLAGAGGGNDIASVAREVVVVAVHRTNRMVEKVRYITCPGTRVSTLATDEGLYVKKGDEFILKGYYAKHAYADQNERIGEIARRCDWQIETAPQLDKLSPPTAGELKLLRSFDPENVFLR
jgi:acyl CoA:acetate/3-ketoacid CoA transferase alpha subunit/acyl CoA:acetate/3-ketoacid CoA transferase beta subunit